MEPPIDRILEELGPTLHLDGETLGGEGGATVVVRDGHGRRLVVKWAVDGDGARVRRMRTQKELTDRLRARGYPAPAVIRIESIDGLAVAVCEYLPGSAAQQQLARSVSGALLDALVPQLLDLVELQAEQAGAVASTWPAFVVGTVLDGRQGWCELATLRSHSAETASVLLAVQTYARCHHDVDTARSDIVHGDFQPANILVEGDQVTGIIDWSATEDGMLAGDRGFDLSTLLFYAWDSGGRDTLLAATEAITPTPAVGLYLGHMIVRQLDWSIRHGHADAVIERYLHIAQSIIGDYLP